MNRLFGGLGALLVASLLLWAADTGAQQQPAPRPGAPPAPTPAAPAPPAGDEKSVEGKIKQWDAATSMLTLDDGTQISVPAGAKVERAKLKEGATVKASYEEKGGKKVAKSIEVSPQWLRNALLTRVNEPGVSVRLKRISPAQLGLVRDRKTAKDRVVEPEGAPALLIGEELSQALAGATIDCQETAEGSKLTITLSRRRQDAA